MEALRIEKFEKSENFEEEREKDLGQKFVKQKRNVKVLKEKKMLEVSLAIGARKKTPGRGLSLCPGEITDIRRRGLSLGPAEIYKSGQLVNQETMATPFQATQCRRKSCFWKLSDIGEQMVLSKERRKSLSLSPKSGKNVVRTQALRQVATTKEGFEERRLDSQFNTAKEIVHRWGEIGCYEREKAPRPGRKRYFLENGNDGSKRCDKKRFLSWENRELYMEKARIQLLKFG